MLIKPIQTNIKIVDKIFHIADIHIRPYKRHYEYKKVFDTLYQSITDRATDNSIIIVLGDIVHAKTEMTPELISIVSDFFIKLSKICITFIIPGNHDANLNNKNRLDALTPIINNIKSDRLFYLKDTGVYPFANLNFVNMSVFDDEQIKIEDVEQFENKIALFHGVVDKAINKFGYHFKNEKIDRTAFDGYDLVLLGDIHKHQYLQEFEIEEIEIDEKDLDIYLKTGWKIKK